MDDFFDEQNDPLDLDGDGDHIIDMCTLLDEDEKRNHNSKMRQGGCFGMILLLHLPGVMGLIKIFTA